MISYIKNSLIYFGLLFNLFLFGQVDVELFFYDSCKDSIIQQEYEVIDFDNSDKEFSSKKFKIKLPSGAYFINFAIERLKDKNSIYSSILEIESIKKYTDTIVIPNILFTTENILHSTYWNYFNCNKLCDGEEVDYYQNGNIRTKGVYNKGKPNYIFEYGEDGIVELKTWYKTGTMDYLKVERFDEIGNLEEYEIYKNRKMKTIIKTYNSKGEFLRREIKKYYHAWK